MNNQLTFVDIPKVKNANTKRNWENRFQRWSNRVFNDGTTPLGKCGYGIICDWCEDSSRSYPCVHALNSMLKNTKGTIDYQKNCFEDVFTHGKQ